MIQRFFIPLLLISCLAGAIAVPRQAHGRKVAAKSAHRFPETYNSNAVAGRLYLQPIGPREDRVVSGITADLSLANTAEYRPRFNDAAKTYRPMRYNTNLLSLRIAGKIDGMPPEMEIGGVFRLVQDNDSSKMADFLKWFHGLIDSKEHIPKNIPYGATIGNGHTSLIGGDGHINLLSPDIYLKFQLLKENDSTAAPDLAVKLSGRIPLSGDRFDTWGIGASLGLSKQVGNQLRLMAATALVYQDLSPRSFRSTDLDVSPLAYDLFGAVAYDFGEKGGYYTTLGGRYSNKRVVYSDNPDSATPATVVHGALNYRPQNATWEIFSTLGEEITAISRALEPDFIVYLGISFFL